MIRDEDDKRLVLLTPSGLRLGLILTIVFMVVSSPILIFSSPISISAKSNNVDTSGQHSAFSLEGTSSNPLMSPSPTNVSPMDSDFTTQAALSLTRATQTSNIVDSKSYYDISFRTTTSGTIKTVEMDFPPGTYVGAALLVEATGIGPGTIAASGSTGTGMKITYTVTNAVNVPALTKIRIQIANVNNPATPSTSLTVSITTRDTSNAIIDGPTSTSAYNMDQIGTGQIEDNAITSTKPAESFMKRVTLLDNAAGNAFGWDPDSVKTFFSITEPAVSGFNTGFVTAYDRNGGNQNCHVQDAFIGQFLVVCDAAPANGGELHYVVENLPAHVP